MNELQKRIKPYSKSIVRLLKGTVENKDSVWEDLLLYRYEIQKYLNQIGVELILKEDDGYAYLRQFEVDEEGNTLGLVSRRQVGFETSILLFMLREIVEKVALDPIDTNFHKKYISHEGLKEEVGMFLPEKYDKVKFLKDLDKYIDRVEKLGYIKEISNNSNEKRYKIHPIVKEKITLDMLKEFKEKLHDYAKSV